jgi:hypothetical protein
MQKYITILLVVFLAASVLAAPASAAPAQDTRQGPPTGSCPAGFALHHIMHHEGDHHDHHIGLEFDLNQDNMICVRHLSSGLHVHVDNVVR